MDALQKFHEEIVECSDKVISSFVRIRGNRKIEDAEIEQLVDWIVKSRFENIVLDLILKGLVCVDIVDGERIFTMTSDGSELYDAVYGENNGVISVSSANASRPEND